MTPTIILTELKLRKVVKKKKKKKTRQKAKLKNMKTCTKMKERKINISRTLKFIPKISEAGES